MNKEIFIQKVPHQEHSVYECYVRLADYLRRLRKYLKNFNLKEKSELNGAVKKKIENEIKIVNIQVLRLQNWVAECDKNHEKEYYDGLVNHYSAVVKKLLKCRDELLNI